jgi:hypothetical protein
MLEDATVFYRRTMVHNLELITGFVIPRSH